MQKYLPDVIGAALIAILLGTALWGVQHFAYQSAQFEQKARVADSLRVVAEMRAHQLRDSLARAQPKRDSSVAQLKNKKARTVASVAETLKAATALPDTCQPTVIALKGAVDSLTAVSDSAFSLYDGQKEATGKLLAANQQLETALNASHEAIKAVPGRSFWAHLLPKVSAGPFAGICANGKPCAGIGVSAGWQL